MPDKNGRILPSEILAARNMSSLERRDEKRKLVLLWIFQWGASTPRVLMRLLGLKTRKDFMVFFNRMIKTEKWIANVGHAQRQRTLYALTPRGHEHVHNLIAAFDLPNVKYARNISYKNITNGAMGLAGKDHELPHNMLVQAIVAELYLANVMETLTDDNVLKPLLRHVRISCDSSMDMTIEDDIYPILFLLFCRTQRDFKTPYSLKWEFGGDSGTNKKYPDAVVYFILNILNQNKKPTACAIELELTQKSGMNFHKMVYNMAGSDINTFLIITTGDTMSENYKRRFDRARESTSLRKYYGTGTGDYRIPSTEPNNEGNYSSELRTVPQLQTIIMLSIHALANIFPNNLFDDFVNLRDMPDADDEL